MREFNLEPLTSGYINSYNDTFDPRITNEFATAAFRFGHSLINHLTHSPRVPLSITFFMPGLVFVINILHVTCHVKCLCRSLGHDEQPHVFICKYGVYMTHIAFMWNLMYLFVSMVSI